MREVFRVYQNKRIGTIPATVATEILGFDVQNSPLGVKMAIRKVKNGSGWIVDISNGFDPITLKQRRIIRKGYKTKKEATEAENYLRSVELKERYFGAKIGVSMLYELLKEEDILKSSQKLAISTHKRITTIDISKIIFQRR